VIVHGRNEQKAKNVVAEIKQVTGNAQVDYLIADLFSMQAVKKHGTHLQYPI
jgi:short-subunit dehydrogenase